MPSLWTPSNWPERLAELQASTPDLKEAPLRRDVRSLGILLGNVLREQAGEPLYEAVEALRRDAIARREAGTTVTTDATPGHFDEATRRVAGFDLTTAYRLAR